MGLGEFGDSPRIRENSWDSPQTLTNQKVAIGFTGEPVPPGTGRGATINRNSQRAVEILKDILENHEGMTPDRPPRVVFNEFLDAALNILVIYWYSPPNHWDFMALNQRINLEILRRFNDEGIEFAFPTQTLYLAGDPNRPLDRRQETGVRARFARVPGFKFQVPTVVNGLR